MTIKLFGETEHPPGAISFFNGDPANIPNGWAICDGNNGTPNLLGRYLKSVPDSSTSPGTTGGQNSYSLSEAQLPAHEHPSSSISSAGEHNHAIPYSTDGKFASDTNSFLDEVNGTTYYESTSSDGSHSHTVSSVSSSGSSSSINGEPSYTTLVPVMRL